MIWVTSDLHLNHTNICGPGLSSWSTGYRNFSSISEMNERLLGNLNTDVAVGDTLYFLGDFAFGDKQAIPSLFERVACRDIRFLYGNHDTWIRKNEKALPSHVRILGDYHEVRQKGVPLIVMSHFPLEVWNERARGSFHLHGHSHGTLRVHKGRRRDVGVDTNGFKPYRLETLLREMDNEPVGCDDHHRTELREA